jgi:heme exporter protein CcmD
MDFASEHLGFVLAAYGISAIVLIGLVAKVLVDARRLRFPTRDKNPETKQ